MEKPESHLFNESPLREYHVRHYNSHLDALRHFKESNTPLSKEYVKEHKAKLDYHKRELDKLEFQWKGLDWKN